MPEYRRGSIITIGDSGGDPGRVYTSPIQFVASRTDFYNFVSYFTTLSKGNLYGDSFIRHRTPDIPPVQPGNGADLDRLAVCKLINTVDGSFAVLTIPAPDDSIVIVTSAGERVDPFKIDEIAARYSLMTGITFRSGYGYIIEKE